MDKGKILTELSALFAPRCRQFFFTYNTNHRKAFYSLANAIFGKIGRIASEEVFLQLIRSKCIPSLLYGFDACTLTKSELSSLDFIVNRFFYEAI